MFRGLEYGDAAPSLEAQITAMMAKLTPEMSQSFAPVKMLISEAIEGFDAHFLQFTNSRKEFKGLLVFNQDSTEPTRVNLLHLSCLDSIPYEEVLDLALDFIWKTMHCSTIRVYMHHYP